jgi:3',5'-cyclic AMP phosphodiesterase CpdA
VLSSVENNAAAHVTSFESIIAFGFVMARIAGKGCPSSIVAKIALLSDPHVNTKTRGLHALFNSRFDEVIKRVNDMKVALVLIAGDLTDGWRAKAQEMKAFRCRIRDFTPPVLFVPGNHDVGDKKQCGGKESPVTLERIKNFESALGPSYFACEYAGVRVIGINSSLFGSRFASEKAQWEFLETALGEPCNMRTLLLMHYPLFTKAVTEPGDYWNVQPRYRKRLLGLLDMGRVAAVVTGHFHRYLVNRYNGTLLLTTPPLSFGLPRNKEPEAWVLMTIPNGGEPQYERMIIG